MKKNRGMLGIFTLFITEKIVGVCPLCDMILLVSVSN